MRYRQTTFGKLENGDCFWWSPEKCGDERTKRQKTKDGVRFFVSGDEAIDDESVCPVWVESRFIPQSHIVVIVTGLMVSAIFLTAGVVWFLRWIMG